MGQETVQFDRFAKKIQRMKENFLEKVTVHVSHKALVGEQDMIYIAGEALIKTQKQQL